MTGVNNSKPNKSSFKKGKDHPRYRPPGSERINKNGHIEIKTEENKWMTKHKYLWEQKHGKIPRGHVVIFANGDTKDFFEDNLLLVSRKQLMALNKYKLITKNSDLTKTGVAVADLLLHIGEVKKGG